MPEYSTNVTNSLIHLYRGEMGRMTLYRVRLDTTTNWTIVTVAGITTFALGDAGVPHVVFLFAMLLTYFFLTLEARRFRIYEMSHQRVRLLEQFFYGEMLGEARDPGWHQEMRRSLATPRSPIPHFAALGWRLRRNYLWIYAAIIVAWAIKLDFLRGEAVSFAEFVSRAAVGAVPGALILALVAAFYLAMAGLAVRASRDYPLEAD